MVKEEIPTKFLDGLSFKLYSSDEIRKMSVMEIKNPNSFDTLMNANENGLYDLRLGPNNFSETCSTCGQPPARCNGHVGYIKLALPVFNPLFMRSTFKLLRVTCFTCHQFVMPVAACCLFEKQMEALSRGLPSLAIDLENASTEIMEDLGSNRTALAAQGLEERLDKMLKDAESVSAGGESLGATFFHTKSIVEIQNRCINTFYKTATSRCANCGTSHPKLFLDNNTRIVIMRTIIKRKTGTKTMEIHLDENDVPVEPKDDVLAQQYFTPTQVREHLSKVNEIQPKVINYLFGSLVDRSTIKTVSPIDALFLDVFACSPPRFRPLLRMMDKCFMNPQSELFNKILHCSLLVNYLGRSLDDATFVIPDDMKYLTSNISGVTASEKLHSAWNELQRRVNNAFDGNLDKGNFDRVPGLKQLLEKKSGLLRKHMMGKRVNFAARSVISPDPYIDIDEVGIPEIFATSLTYPTPVTPWNVKELRQAVINGPTVHPGANYVKLENNAVMYLSATDKKSREAIAKQLLTPSEESGQRNPKVVYRHLRNGDIMLLNRQPTLHKPSIMAHKARVLKGERTLRLNYSNCKTYNADFDGDEMNAHFPQSELARSEAYNIASVNHQYLVPKDGTPLGGLIQDHIVAAVLLMVRGKFFNRADYHQLIFSALGNKDGRIKLMPPAIMKPRMMWTGKQVASAVIINTIPDGQHRFSLTRKAKTPVKCWERETPRKWKAGGTPLSGIEMSESEVIVREGELLCGVLDKGHCGPTPYGLIHCCYEIYGGEVAILLLSRLERLFSQFLQIEGFTLGVEDILVVPKADKKRKHLMKKASRLGRDVICEALGLPSEVADEDVADKYAEAHLRLDDKQIRNLDMCMKAKTDQVNNDINKVCMPTGLRKQFPENNLQLMVLSGSKGATVNCMQISCLLGQIELEGRRPPMMISGRTLPAFQPYCTSPRAGGFVDGRFLTGIKPQEYFFHCMAGREGLIDTAVKTSRSGYLQRCLIKHLEGLAVAYDLTVRDSDGTVIQFMFGEDALDILKVPFLREDQLQFLVDNHKVLQDKSTVEKLCQLSECDYDKLLKKQKKIQKQQRKLSKCVGGSRIRSNGFTTFAYQHLPELREIYPGFAESTSVELAKEKVVDMWHQLTPDERWSYSKEHRRASEPIFSTHRPDTNFGAISEKLDQIIESYLLSRPPGIRDNDSEKNRKMPTEADVRKIFHHKIMTSFCEPGEAVGLLAAQSVGEPSTQMTLNTFHFAGRGEMNVTLGIPRLREILMAASKIIKTPSMEIPFLNVPNVEAKAATLRKKLSRVYLSAVVESIETTDTVTVSTMELFRLYRIKFNFLPRESYKDETLLTPETVLRFMETKFLAFLAGVLLARAKMLAQSTFIGEVIKSDKNLVNTKLGEEDGEGPKQDDDLYADDAAVNDADDSSGDEFEDDDAAAVKSRGKHEEEREYDEEDAEASESDSGLEEEGDTASVGSRASKVKMASTKNTTSQEVVVVDDSEQDSDEEVTDTSSDNIIEDVESDVEDETKKKKKSRSTPRKKQIALLREQAVLNRDVSIKEYSYDTKKSRWCEVVVQMDVSFPQMDASRIVKEEVAKAIIRHTSGLKMAFVSDQSNAAGVTTKILKTDGINIAAMFKHENLLDLRRLHTNHVYEMSMVYGIEAAGRVLVKEIQNVFQVYGIEVDPRHLLLIADYMTCDGTYRPFNRTGMNNCLSPLQQMTFETTTNFMKAATLMGLSDRLKSPSACLVVGKPVGCGTGSFDLIQKVGNKAK